MLQGLIASLFACATALVLLADALAQTPRVLDCEANFPPTASAAQLAERFGAGNVASADISVGEGQYEKGTVLFADTPDDKVEILWKDARKLRAPLSVRVQGERSNWRTRSGLSLGDDLRKVERLNQRPFRLLGFGWDYGGTAWSWSGGALARADSAGCAARIRLSPDRTDDNSHWYRQVTGDREFSSSHPAMQALNPRIYEVWLQY